MDTPGEWLRTISKLKVDRASGDPAPHKPLLLLVVLDLAERGILAAPIIPLTPELAFQFCTFWTVVAHRRKQRPDIRLPFHHLQSDGFWTCYDAEHRPSVDYRITRYAQMNLAFAGLMNNPAFRNEARRILIVKYFQPQERIALASLLGIQVPPGDDAAISISSRELEDPRKMGRDARFRLNVAAAYAYACALTGYRLTTITGGTIVDAAHIHRFADSRNNDVGNGLALCKNAHWLFDNGLWTLTDDYKVLVAIGEFSEDCGDQRALEGYDGLRINLPADAGLWPSPAHVAWHRAHVFRGS
jgi:putative restriction endonuclease